MRARTERFTVSLFEYELSAFFLAQCFVRHHGRAKPVIYEYIVITSEYPESTWRIL